MTWSAAFCEIRADNIRQAGRSGGMRNHAMIYAE
jgi:hypothetical protein